MTSACSSGLRPIAKGLPARYALRAASKMFGVVLPVLATVGCSEAGPSPTPPPFSTPTPDSVRVAWLGQQVAPIRSVDPHDEDWSDLEPLGRMIGDARIVLLGEPSHGDGTTFLAKRRIVRYLHQELGFDVLAIESGLFPVSKVAELAGDPGRTYAEAAESAIFPIWTGSAQFRPLLDYLEGVAVTNFPLELAGFDSQLWGSATEAFFVDDLEALLRRGGVALVDEPRWGAFRPLLQSAVSFEWWDTKPLPDSVQFFEGVYQEVEAAVSDLQSIPDDERDFWTQVLASTRVQIEIERQADPSQELQREHVVARDLQMGDNLRWLAEERYPGRRIIVWTANYHLVRRVADLELVSDPAFYNGMQTMGDVLDQALGHDAFTIGFTAYRGAWGAWTEPAAHNIVVPESESVEAYFSATGVEHALLSLRDLPSEGRWLEQPRIGRFLGYVDIRGRWPQHVDAVFFSDRMTPSTRAPGVVGDARSSGGWSIHPGHR